MFNNVINNIKHVEEQRVQSSISYNPVIWNSFSSKRQIAIDPSKEQEAYGKVSRLTMNELNSTPNVLANASTVMKQATFGVEVREVAYKLSHIILTADTAQDKAEAVAILGSKMLEIFDLSMVRNSSNSLISVDNSEVLTPDVAITNSDTFLKACVKAKRLIRRKLNNISTVNVYMSGKYLEFYEDMLLNSVTQFEFGMFSQAGLRPVMILDSVGDMLIVADESACDVSYAYTPTVIKDGFEDMYDSYWARIVTGNVNIIAKEKHIQKIIG
jgi:hypothetical protein